MSIAAVSRIVEAPDPPDSGTTMRIEKETGPRFPTPPLSSFTGLLWQTNRVPVLGVNAEEVTVTGIDVDLGGDVVTMVRAADEAKRISVYPGMSLSLLRAYPVYDLGEAFKIRGPASGEGGTLTLQTPQGAVQQFSGTELAQDGEGWYIDFVAEEPGRYAQSWSGDGELFYINYGEVT